MSRASHQIHPRFRIGAHDRVTIDGTPFRLLQQTEDAFVLLPDGGGLAQTFPFARLNALETDGRVGQDLDFFLPPAMRAPGPLATAALPIAHLTERERGRLGIRAALVEGFKELHSEGRVQKTEASIDRNKDLIRERARPYLEEKADLVAIDHEARAAAGEGRRRSGGRLEAIITPVHPSTLLRWVRAERREGKSGLVDGCAKRGYRLSRFGNEENALLIAEVRNSFLHLNRPTIKTTVDDVKIAFAAENARRQADNAQRQDVKKIPLLKVPGRKAIRSCIASLDALEVAVARHGPEEAMKRFRPVGRGLEVARPIERVEIDEWRIDLMSILAGSGLLALFEPAELAALGLDGSIARWSIVVAIDCRTRVILGMILTPDPRASAAIACLRMITSDKGEISDATGAAVRWSQFGTPELLASDNGAAFKAAEFTTACNDLGITHQRTIAGAPNMRATIERFFRTCAVGLLPRLSGRTFSDVVERAHHPAEARACLEPGDLCFSLVRWIVDIYHNTPHEGLGGRTPLAQWEADHRDRNYPLRVVPDRRKKRLAFGIGLQRTVGREGVVFLGIRYHSEALAAFHQSRGGRTVDLRVDPADLGIVEVCIDGAWQEVPAVHEGFDGLPVPVWRAARRNLQTSSSRRAEWEEAVVADAILAIKGLNQHRTLAFGLIDKGYTREQLDGLERSLSAGFRITATQPKLRDGGGGPGRSVVPVAPVEADPAKAPPPPPDGMPAVDRPRKRPRSTGTPVGPPADAVLAEPPRPTVPWTFDE